MKSSNTVQRKCKMTKETKQTTISELWSLLKENSFVFYKNEGNIDNLEELTYSS